MISIKYNFAFVHIPKTAGTSIRQWLIKVCEDPLLEIWDHIRAKDIKYAAQPWFWDKVFKFAFVRNPWDRMVSDYSYVISSDFPESKAAWKAWVMQQGSFRNYLLNLPSDHPGQLPWICDSNNNLLVDFVGRFEQLEKDLEKVAERLRLDRTFPLPHANKSFHTHYSMYYDQDTKSLVAERYKDEIEMFGYKYEERSYPWYG